MTNVLGLFRKFIDQELKGMYTTSVAVVEEVDHYHRRCKVSLKRDKEVLIDNVPIGSIFAGDDVGFIIPIEKDDEGLLFHTREPLDKLVLKEGHQEIIDHRHHSIPDAVFLPQMWLDTERVPEHFPKELHLKYGKSSIRIGEFGTIRLEHPSGNQLVIDDEGITIFGTMTEKAKKEPNPDWEKPANGEGIWTMGEPDPDWDEDATPETDPQEPYPWEDR